MMIVKCFVFRETLRTIRQGFQQFVKAISNSSEKAFIEASIVKTWYACIVNNLTKLDSGFYISWKSQVSPNPWKPDSTWIDTRVCRANSREIWLCLLSVSVKLFPAVCIRSIPINPISIDWTLEQADQDVKRSYSRVNASELEQILEKWLTWSHVEAGVTRFDILFQRNFILHSSLQFFNFLSFSQFFFIPSTF